YWTAAEKEKAEKGKEVEKRTIQGDDDSNNDSNNDANKDNGSDIFDDEAILGDLSEKMWTLTVDFINNQDNIDKHVQFDKTPDGEDDEDAGVDSDIDEDEEDEPLLDNRNVQRNHQLSLTFLLNPKLNRKLEERRQEHEQQTKAAFEKKRIEWKLYKNQEMAKLNRALGSQESHSQRPSAAMLQKPVHQYHPFSFAFHVVVPVLEVRKIVRNNADCIVVDIIIHQLVL
ncbi:hypothetical protein EC957_008395, partial [Mortierella hygrophila]